jgi:general secretion pathway protein M
MTALRASGRTRMLVLAVHVAALAGGVAYAWSEWSDVAAQQAAVEQTRQMIGQLDARLAATGGLHNANAAAQAALDPFLPGDSAAVAGANLQDRVVLAIRKAGGTVTSSQVDTTGTTAAGAPIGTAAPAIQLTVSCQIGNAALQALLYGLESEVPALFLDQITVESEDRASNPAPGGGTLKIAMVISAYWTGDGKS